MTVGHGAEAEQLSPYGNRTVAASWIPSRMVM